MGLLRGSFVSILIAILFFSVFVGGVLLTASMSLDKKNIEIVAKNVVSDSSLDLFESETGTNESAAVDQIVEENVPDFVAYQGKVMKWFYYVLVFSIVLAVILFFMFEDKSSFFIVLGVIFTVASLPLLAIGKVLGFFDFNFIEYLSAVVSQVSMAVFWTFFIFGLILLGIGIVLKFLLVGYSIGKMFSKSNEKSKESKQIKSKKLSKQKPRVNG